MTPDSVSIAASYEGCLQSFNNLLAVLQNVNDDCCDSDEFHTVENEFGRLRYWDIDTHASTGDLDYVLRRATHLRDFTVEILQAIQATIEEGIEILRKTPRLSESQAFSRKDSANIESDTALLTSLDYSDIIQYGKGPQPWTGPQQLEPSSKGLDEGNAENEVELGTKIELTRWSQLSRSPLELCLEDLVHYSDCLYRLSFVLQSPAPVDTYHNDASPQDAKNDIDLTRQMFPVALPYLVERFGKANWKRRQQCNKLREQLWGPPMSRPTTTYSNTRAASVDQSTPGVFRNMDSEIFWSSQKQNTGRNPHHDRSYGTGTSVALSTFSDSRSEMQSFTSIATSASRAKPDRTRLQMPNCPVLLSDRETKCPYCAKSLSLTDHWPSHVFRDLEPYLCTFEKCRSGNRTFTTSEDWFQHELDFHRSRKVHHCRPCDREFPDSSGLEEHFLEDHAGQLSTSQIPDFTILLEKTIIEPFFQVPCPLCGLNCQTAEEYKSHLSDDMEQLALTAIPADDNQIESIDKVKLSNLNDYVEEQLAIFWPQQAVPNDSRLNSNVDGIELLEVSDDGNHTHNYQAYRPPDSPVAWLEKVDDFLAQQSKEVAIVEQEQLPGSGPALRTEVATLGGLNPTPTDSIITTVFHPRNDRFVGRTPDLAAIHEKLARPGTLCIISGHGGIGKSQMALEYAYRYEEHFRYIFWISAETDPGREDTFVLIAKRLGLAEGTDLQDNDKLIALGRNWLDKSTKRWLIVFDNVGEEWSHVTNFLPQDISATQGSVLITSRLLGLRKLSDLRIELGVLSLEDSATLLLSSIDSAFESKDTTTHPEYQMALRVSALVGCLPLAISHVAGYIQVSLCSIAEFLELWEERRQRKDFTEEDALETTWNISLRELWGEARNLIEILAFLHSENIQTDLLIQPHEEPSLQFLHSENKGGYKRMTTNMSRRKLITVSMVEGRESLTIHRLLQQNILKELSKNSARCQRIFDQTFAMVRKRYPRPSPIQAADPKVWPVCKEFLPHVERLRAHFLNPALGLKSSVELAQLFSDGGINLWDNGYTRTGMKLVDTAEKILDTLDFDRESSLRADIHTIKSLLCLNTGISQRREGLVRSEKSLQIRALHISKQSPEQITNEDEYLLFNAKSDYACCLLQYDRFEDADIVLEECLEKYKTWGSIDEVPFEYAKYYHDKAFVLFHRNQAPKALEYAQLALSLAKRARGPESSVAYLHRFDLACFYWQLGDLEKALELHREILEARIKSNASTDYKCQSYYAVGSLYYEMGEFVQAEERLRECLRTAESDNWTEESIARAKVRLSQILHAQGRFIEDGLKYKEEAEQILNRELKSDFPAHLAPGDDPWKFKLYDYMVPHMFNARQIPVLGTRM